MQKFELFSSKFNADFWSEFAQRKVDKLQLNNDPIPIQAFFSPSTNEESIIPPLLEFTHASFGPISQDSKSSVTLLNNSGRYNGYLINTNTIEEFKALDLKSFAQNLVANEIWLDIKSGKALETPDSSLFRFILFAFSDLKRFTFTYLLCVPALIMSSPITLVSSHSISEILSPKQLSCLSLLFPYEKQVFVLDLSDKNELPVLELKDWKHGMIACVLDPSNKQDAIGWPARNVLALLRHSLDCSFVSLLSIRHLKSSSPPIASSIVYDLKLDGSVDIDNETVKFTGFEKDSKGNVGPRFVDLAGSMDPIKMAQSTVDLNLKLMRWRLVPELKLDDITSKKCLLIGAGTLGCYVSRVLMGWGVRDITFIDNGSVSYSNMARQPLYSFSDYGKSKSKCAAENLKAIYPSMNAKGIQLSVPMPGHGSSGSTKEEIERDFNLLLDEINNHHVVFLLMDSRESRWLPTVLCKHLDKIVINIALGFDSFLVMRHGSKNAKTKVGCYYCNDIVAPIDSLRSRSLDQQCTVTRPGLAPIASGIGVELLMSILQHPLRHAAPPSLKDDVNSTCLGGVPHQIRGFLKQFSNMVITGEEYSKCTACSSVILKKYEMEGFDFIYSALLNPSILEQVTGLKEMQETAISFDVDWDESD